jgi:hypothetical protein
LYWPDIGRIWAKILAEYWQAIFSQGCTRTAAPEFEANKSRPIFGQYMLYWASIGQIVIKKWSTNIRPLYVVLAKYWLDIGPNIGHILAVPFLPRAAAI